MIAGVVLISVITVPDRDLLNPAILTFSTDYALVREQPFHLHTTFPIRPAECISMITSKKYDVTLRSRGSWSLAVSADPLACRQTYSVYVSQEYGDDGGDCYESILRHNQLLL